MISAMVRKVTDGGAYKAAISRFVQFYRQTWTSDIYIFNNKQTRRKVTSRSFRPFSETSQKK